MNFAFCLFNYFPFGGLQRDLIRIAEECLARGHRVNIYTMRWAGEPHPGLSITLLPPRGWQNYSQCAHFAAQLHQQLAKQSFDLIVGFNKIPGLDVYYAADTCFQAKARAKHGAWFRFTPRYRQYVEFEKSVFTSEAKTQILLLSKHQQAEFVKYYQTPASRFHLLPPGISADRIAPYDASTIRAQQRAAFGIDSNQLLLLMIGSGFKTKGLDRILLGIAHLPSELKKRIKLFVVGEDRSKSYQHQAKQLHIADKIHFLGGRKDVPHFLLAADALLHPAYNENTGTVLLEALVAGLPVLTTDVCGYAHYIQQAVAGIVLPSPFQQAQFNHALEEILLSSHRQQWQQNALAFAKQANIYHLPAHAVNILESLGHNHVSLSAS